MPLEQRPRRLASLPPPPPAPAPATGNGFFHHTLSTAQNVDATISDDRTRDSAFETSGQQWVALKPLDDGPRVVTLTDYRVTGTDHLDAHESLSPARVVPSDTDIHSFEPKGNKEAVEATKARHLKRAEIRARDRQKTKEMQKDADEMPARLTASWDVPRQYYSPLLSSEYPPSPRDTKIPATGTTSVSVPSPTRTQDDQEVKTGYGAQPGQSDAEWQEVLFHQSMGTMAKLLGIPATAAISLDTMRAYISNTHDVSTPPKDALEPVLLEVHYVFDGPPPREDSSIYEDNIGRRQRQAIRTDSPERYRMYLDQPRWRSGANKRQKILIGDLPMDNLGRYLSRHPDVSFVLVKQYNALSQKSIAEAYNAAARADHISESIIPITRSSRRMVIKFVASIGVSYISASRDDSRIHHIDTLLRYTDNAYDRDLDSDSESGSSDTSGVLPSRSAYLEDMDGAQTLTAPYLPIYHARGPTLDKFRQTLHGKESTEFQLMLNCILSNYEGEYAAVDSLVAEGNIYTEYVEYLFRPGMVVVQGHGDDVRSYMCVSGLTSTAAPLPTAHYERILHGNSYDAWDVVSDDPEPQIQRDEADKHCVLAWQWRWRNGFKKTRLKRLVVDLSQSDRSKQKISCLELRPLSFVSKVESERLKNRGQWFWRCRKKQMVSYKSETDQKSHFANDRRYMIDMQVYQELHGKKDRNSNTTRPTWMDAENPPDENFVYLSPLTIKGYNLKTKKWQDLCIDGLSEVTWNTAAFDSLVLNGKTKRLIQALISNQIETEMSTDIIAGKGNGLIMLLHGGPGTGKTLTAESVAEIARRPLYPVTCGDIGTEPAAVERYLESVLHLGKTWGCVVLLDEADVFLEQRSLEDLHRNALVSVFLRVLEYYDGILVLTSNRVGTFDEAFRSRIQLAIHYTSLTTHQRTKIWENFFTRLEQLAEDGIDFVDLKDNVDKLARHNMNGREIRNVITTARQFARWERKQAAGEKYKLDYKVMEEVIETSGEFDKYIAKLNHGFTQDQLAEDEGLRLANNVG